MRIEKAVPGSFCWPELATTDPSAAKSFYSALFGWTANDSSMGEGFQYTTLNLENLPVAAMYPMMEEQRKQGIPPHWLLYVAVESAAAAAARVAALGGKVIVDTMEVMDYGKMAVVQDPQGAVFALWEPLTHHGALILNEPGAFSWSELATSNVEKARDFYISLFDWGLKIDTTEDYTEIINNKDHIGGIMPLYHEGMPPHWKPYFRVTDANGIVDKAKGLGATVLYGPQEIQKVGPIAVLQDPQGAVFAIVQLMHQ